MVSNIYLLHNDGLFTLWNEKLIAFENSVFNERHISLVTYRIKYGESIYNLKTRVFMLNTLNTFKKFPFY